MNNKKYVIVAGVVVVALVVAGIVVGNREAAPAKESTDSEAIQETIKAMYAMRLGTVTLLMPDTKRPVTLEDGAAFVEAAPGSASMVEVRFDPSSDIEVVQVGTGDAMRVDVLAVYTVSYGGSGTYKYVALFNDDGETLAMKSIALVGDRVQIDGISTQALSGVDGEEYLVTVEYLDRAEGSAMTDEPTVASKKLFVVERGAFNLSKTDTSAIEQGKE